jgi:hypothetical protein|tara:strand:- start:944 stop:2191 length:1248 start_codon:yes stop_codon:yes gene_type:complete
MTNAFLTGGPNYAEFPVQLFNGDGSTVTFGPLTELPGITSAMHVFADYAKVRDADITLTDSGGGASSKNYITFSAAPSIGTANVEVYFQGVEGVFVKVSDFIVDNFTDTTDYTSGTTQALTASADPGSLQNIEVTFDGVTQHVDTYSMTGLVVNFTTIIPLGVNDIQFKIGTALPIGTPSDGTINTTKLATDAVTTLKILNDAITTAKILNANITTAKIADNAVSLAKMAGGTANKFLGYNGSGDPVELDEPGGGKVLQMVQAVRTGTQVFATNNTFLNATGITAAITPSSSSSKILVQLSLSFSGEPNAYAGGKIVFNDNGGSFGDMAGSLNTTSGYALLHFGMGVTYATNENYRIKPASFHFLHSPSSTNELVYKLQTWHQSDNIVIGKAYTYNDPNASVATPSIITLTEIGA